jgi:hypothetical protein
MEGIGPRSKCNYDGLRWFSVDTSAELRIDDPYRFNCDRVAEILLTRRGQTLCCGERTNRGQNEQTGVRPAICAILWNARGWSTHQHPPIFFAPTLIPDKMITSFMKTLSQLDSDGCNFFSWQYRLTVD